MGLFVAAVNRERRLIPRGRGRARALSLPQVCPCLTPGFLFSLKLRHQLAGLALYSSTTEARKRCSTSAMVG